MAGIRILLVDDHPLVRRHLCNLLERHANLTIVSEASSGLEAVRKAEEFQPDVVLLDLSIPDLNGFQAAPLIKKVAPATEILIVSQHDNAFFVRQGFAAGARGFLTKSDAGTELLTAIRTVHLKRKFVSRSIENIAVGAAVEQQNPNPPEPAASSD